jgi:hypothetical protein
MPRKPLGVLDHQLSKFLTPTRQGPIGSGAGGLRNFPLHHSSPGTLGRLDLSQLLADAGSSILPNKMRKSAATSIHTPLIFKGVENVDRADRKTFNENFDWLSTFTTEKFALIPEPISADDSAIRAKMCNLLSLSPLATEIFAKISDPSRRDRAERLAWILTDGRLGAVKSGSIQEVVIPPPPGHAIGLLHSHVIMGSFISPPSVGSGNNDYDNGSLKDYPMQFVVESDSRRVWGQFQGARTSILGRLSLDGHFLMIGTDDPVSNVVYRTMPLDDWNAQQEDLARKNAEQARESLKKKLMDQKQTK